MNLSVFKTAENARVVEISSPSLKSNLKWFVPLLAENSEKSRNIKSSDVIRVTFAQAHLVPYMLVRTVRIEENPRHVVGTLSPEDSTNLLNNVYDRLAFDQ